MFKKHIILNNLISQKLIILYKKLIKLILIVSKPIKLNLLNKMKILINIMKIIYNNLKQKIKD